MGWHRIEYDENRRFVLSKPSDWFDELYDKKYPVPDDFKYLQSPEIVKYDSGAYTSFSHQYSQSLNKFIPNSIYYPQNKGWHDLFHLPEHSRITGIYPNSLKVRKGKSYSIYTNEYNKRIHKTHGIVFKTEYNDKGDVIGHTQITLPKSVYHDLPTLKIFSVIEKDFDAVPSTVLEKDSDSKWYRNNEVGYQPTYVYNPLEPFPKWFHINYGAIDVTKENHSAYAIDKYKPNRSYILVGGQLYSFDSKNNDLLSEHGIYKNKDGFYQDINEFYSKKHNKTIVDIDRRVAFNPEGQLVVGEDITTEFFANNNNRSVIFSKLSLEEIAYTKRKWYRETYEEDDEGNLILDEKGRHTRYQTYEEYLAEEGYIDDNNLSFPDRSEQDFTDYLGRPVTDLDRPERIKTQYIKPLHSQIKISKDITNDSNWSAPIIVMDTESTDVNASKQLVNIAAVKLRYNFKTQQIAIEDAYERYYLPDWNKLAFRGMDINSAFVKYNTSESVALTGLTTQQLERQMRKQSKKIHATFDFKEQSDFIGWAINGDDNPIFVGNNIGFDLDFINNAFTKKTGHDLTAIDLMQLAQSNSILRGELEKNIQKLGRAGRLSIPGLMTWLVDPKYGGEQHIGGADVLDSIKIMVELLRRNQNNVNPTAWSSERGLYNILKKGSRLTSEYVHHPWNIVDTIYEFDEYDNRRKAGTVGAAITNKERKNVIKSIADNFKDSMNLTQKEYHDLIDKLSKMDNKTLFTVEHMSRKMNDEMIQSMMSNSNFALNTSNNIDYESAVDTTLSRKTAAEIYLGPRLSNDRKDKKRYNKRIGSMLASVTDDEVVEKSYGIDYIDEDKWTVDPYDPEANLNRKDLKYGKNRSWQDIGERGGDVIYYTPDEIAMLEIRTLREQLPGQFKNDIRWNRESHKWEVKKYKLKLEDIYGNEYNYYQEMPLRYLKSHVGYVSANTPEYGKNIVIDNKSYTIIGVNKTWEDYMAELKSQNQIKAANFWKEINAGIKYGFLSRSILSRDIRFQAWNMANRVTDEVKLGNFVSEIPSLRKLLQREYRLNQDIVSGRRRIDDSLAGLVADRRLSQGDADFIKNYSMAQIDNAIKEGSMSVEKFEEIMAKFNRTCKEATAAEDRRVESLTKANRLLKKISPMYDFNNVYQAGYAQINGVIGAANGILPRFAMAPIQRAGAAIINGLEVDRARYNYYMRTANTLKGIVTMGAGIAGAFAAGPLGSAAGSAIGAGLGEAGVSMYNQWLYDKEKKITTTGNLLQNSFNTVGFLKSISGLDIAFSALTKTVKWATLGFIGMVTKGLHSMQSLGNPITTLSGVDYGHYQMYGRMDRMFGFAGGTINSSIENFALQQRRMYTYGQMDIDRVVAASMLGVFGNVYANGGDPKKNYEETVNKIASGGITDTKLSWAAMIDKTLPQILQIMKDMNATSLRDVYRKSGLKFYELTEEGRKEMRKTSFGYRTALSNMSTMWQTMGAAVWNGGLDKIFERITKWLEVISKNAGTWMSHLNPLVDAFDNLFKALGSGDTKQIESAVENLKEAFGGIIKVIKEPITKLVAGLSVAMMSAVQAMMPHITEMIQGLITQISQFNFDKDALMSNMNNGTDLPVIRYGAQKGQFRWLGESSGWYKDKYDEIVGNNKLSTDEKIKQLEASIPKNGPGFGIGKSRWVATRDYNPVPAVESANSAIGTLSNNIMSDDMMGKVMKMFMEAMDKVMKIDVNVNDGDTGNTRKMIEGERVSLGHWTTEVSLAE